MFYNFNMAKPFRDFSGMKIGQYEVLRRVGVTKTGAGLWECVCSCGTIFQLGSGTIGSGIQQSCGCLRGRNQKPKTGKALKHGYTSNGVISAEAKSYYGARNKCLNPNNSGYGNYGGRGIEFRIESLRVMVDEIGLKPEGDYNLGRKDPNGHYEKGNIEWQTPKAVAAKRQRPERMEVGCFKIDGKPCRLIQLTLDQWMIVDAEDYERLCSVPWYAMKNSSGKHYASNSEYGTVHRFLLGPVDGLHVDHDNENTLDNRKINLRPATQTDNNRNVGKTVRNKSGLKGVSEKKNGIFTAAIHIGDKCKWLGDYDTKKEAHMAWCYAAVFYHGKFANCGCSPSCIGRL
jgi:hypothetical protein